MNEKLLLSALNNREVQNYVHRRKPPTYTKALHIANDETSFILMDLATHAPSSLQAPIPGDTSFIAALKAKRTDLTKGAPQLDASTTTPTRKDTSKRGAQPGSRTSSSSTLTRVTTARVVPQRLLATGTSGPLRQLPGRSK